MPVKTLKRQLAVLVGFLLLASSILGYAVGGAPTATVVGEETVATAPGEQAVDSVPAPELATMGSFKDPVRVMVICSDPSEVANALKDVPYEGALGARGAGEIISPVLRIPRYALETLKGAPGVLGIIDYDELAARGDEGLEESLCGDAVGDEPATIQDAQHLHGVEAWAKGFTGQGITVALTEVGVDFGNPDLSGTQAREGPVWVQGEAVATAAAGQTEAYLDHGNLVTGTLVVTRNGAVMTSGVTADLVTGRLTFSPALALNDSIAANYQYYSPYYGWPIVFDRASMSGYISSGGDTKSTWFVNTSFAAQVTKTVNYDVAIDNEAEWGAATEYYNSWVPKVAGSAESNIVDGLEPGKAYLFAVRAYDEKDTPGAISNSANAVSARDSTPPGRITNLAAIAGDDQGTVTLSWTAPGDDGATGQTVSYLIKHSNYSIANWVCFEHNSFEYSQSLVPQVAGSLESLTLTSLPAGKQLYFAIEAVDEAGNRGQVSNSPTATTTVDLYTPGVITDLAVDSTGLPNNMIRLTWTAPDDDAGNTGGGKKCAVYEARSLDWMMPIVTEDDWNFSNPADFVMPAPALPGTVQSVIVSRPFAGPGIYYFAIRAFDDVGHMAPISNSPTGDPAQDISLPWDIGNFTVETGDLHACVWLNFTAPGDDYMTGNVARYVVRYNTAPITNDGEFDSAVDWPWADPTYYDEVNRWNPPLTPGGTESHQIGLINGGPAWFPAWIPAATYFFAIKAEDEGGNRGNLSASPGSLTQNDLIAPETIDDLVATPGAVHGSVNLVWTAPGDDGATGTAYEYDVRLSTSAITNDVEFAAATGFAMQTKPKAAGLAEACTITGLTGGTQYYFSVKARDDGTNWGGVATAPGPSWANAIATNDAVPPAGIVTLAAATADQSGQVRLTWNAPGDDGASGTAARYSVRYRPYIAQGRYIQFDKQKIGVLNVSYNLIYHNVTGINSASGVYKIGNHPDQNLARYVNNKTSNIYNYSRVLVVDSVLPRVYDTVYVDVDNDTDFSDEKPCRLGDEIATKDLDADGLADLSGGMVYFISSAKPVIGEAITLAADGLSSKLAHANVVNNSWIVYAGGTPLAEGKFTVDMATGSVTFNPAVSGTITADYEYDGLQIPYSERYCQRNGLKNIVPGNGDIVCMVGEFTLDATSGTERASAIVGQGKIAHTTPATLRSIVGLAPEAKLMTVCDLTFDGIVFAMEGYDGVVGTGDEADIVSSGMASTTVYESGLDTSSLYMDYLATQYSRGRTSVVVTSGGSGAGYGTVSSPGAAPGVITAGLAIDFTYRTIGGTYENGPHAGFGDVISSSGRGPTVAGIPKPDVVSNGAYFDFTSRPLYIQYSTTATSKNIVDLWPGGQALTSSVTASALAVVYQAYGSSTQYENDDSVLGSAIGDEHVLRLKYENIVPASFRLFSNGTQLTGTAYTMYPANGTVILASAPGFTARINASYQYTGMKPRGYDVHRLVMSGANDINYDVFVQGAGSVNISRSVDIASNVDGASVSPPRWVPGDYKGTRYEAFVKFVDAATPAASLQQEFVVRNHGAALQSVPLGTEILQKTGEFMCSVHTTPTEPHITSILNGTGFYTREGDLLTPLNTTLWQRADLMKISSYCENQTGYWFEAFDWTDTNGNGWADQDSATDPYPGAVAWGERNRFGVSLTYSTTHDLRVYDPANRTHNGLLLWNRGNVAPTCPTTWWIKAETYEYKAWDWVNLSSTSLNVPGGGLRKFTATLNKAKAVAAGPGTYEGALKIGTIVIPVAITVPMDSTRHVASSSISVTGEIVDANYSQRWIIHERQVKNETSANTTAGQSWLQLAHGNITNQTYICYVDFWGLMWYWLDPSIDYTVDNVTGNVTIAPGSTWMIVDDGYFCSWYTYLVDKKVDSARKLAHSNIKPGSLKVYKNGTMTSIYGEVVRELVYKNNVTIRNESVVEKANAPLTTIQLKYGLGTEWIGWCALHWNNTLLWPNVDYVLDSQNGTVHFPTAHPLPKGSYLMANYSYYYKGKQIFSLSHGELSPGFRGPANLKGYNIWKSGQAQGSSACTVYETNGTVIFTAPIGFGDIIEADYFYGTYTPDYSIGKIDFIFEPTNFTVVSAAYDYYDCAQPYSAQMLYGMSDHTGSGKGGDWRYYYTSFGDGELNNDPNMKLQMNVDWMRTGSDIDCILMTKKDLKNPLTDETFSGARYGPHGLQVSGGSTETSTLFTAAEGKPMERAVAPISPGLNVIALHNTRVNGTMNIEAFDARVGTTYFSSEGISVKTNKLAGSATVSAISSMAWNGNLSGVAAGPSAPEKRVDQLVYQDDPDWTNFDTFQDQLASGNTTIYINLTNCLIFDVHIYGQVDFGHKDIGDLDLGVFLDGKDGSPKDYVTQVEEFVAMDADSDANEHVKLIAPKDGCYMVRVYGFTLKLVPGHYDVDITVVQGLGFSMIGDGPDIAKETNVFKSNVTLMPFHNTNLKLEWNLPANTGEGAMMGALYLGPGDGFMCLLLPIDLTIDYTKPDLSGTAPAAGATVSDTNPLISASLTDLVRGEMDKSTFNMWVDGRNVTGQSSISAPSTQNANSVYGYWSGSITYETIVPLAEGAHTATITAGDFAGNIVNYTWSFDVDTSAPMLELSSPADMVTFQRTNDILVAGITEQHGPVIVFINGTQYDLVADVEGKFQVTGTLLDGENEILVRAVDGGKNVARVTRTVIVDTLAPSLLGAISTDTGSTTNKEWTTLKGSVSEQGWLTVNGESVGLMTDGSWSSRRQLSEGLNVFAVRFADVAGNENVGWRNVTRDSVAPELTLFVEETTVPDGAYNLSGTSEEDATVSVNGKPVSVSDTGRFFKTVDLSWGVNTIVIEAKDRAGNVVQKRLSVLYEEEPGTNWGAIGLMVALLVVGLFIGLLLMYFLKPGAPAEEVEEVPPGEEVPPPTEEPTEEKPESEEEGEVEGLEKEKPESEEPEVEEPGKDELKPEEPVEELPPPRKDVPAIPKEEAMPVELPAKKGPVAKPSAATPAPDVAKADKLARLKKALDDGKISKELYEKNVARIKGSP
jgi:hypothetical protein